MAFTPPYDINPNPNGDTVADGIEKNDGNILAAYEHLNLLLSMIETVPATGSEILAELLLVDGVGSGLDAEYLGGRIYSEYGLAIHSHDLATTTAPGFMAALDKQKLDEMQVGAEVNVQADWNTTSASHDSFIRNKPKVAKIEGSPQDGYIGVFTGPLSMRGASSQEMQGLLDFFLRTDFINQSTGVPDAGKPIVLGGDGLVNPSMIPAVPAQAIWGAITGTLANQTDLQDELDLKLDLSGGIITGNLIIEGLARVYGSFALEDYFSIHDYNDVTQGRSRMAFDKDKGLNIQLRNASDIVDNTLDLTVNGYPVYHEGNPPPGGGGDVDWGDIGGTLSHQVDLQAELNAKANISHDHDSLYFLETEHISTSAGAGDAGKPIILGSNGQIDPSMMDVSVFYYVGSFTPVAGTEYPDTTGETHGAFWVVQGVDAGTGYTFAGGDLSGLTVNNGDFMVFAAAGWSIMAGEMNPILYYRLDGSQPLTDHFQAGGFILRNIGAPSSSTDAINRVWATNNLLSLTGGTVTGILEISHDASAIMLSNTDHAYIYGVDSSGSSGWFFGRGNPGSDRVSLRNYNGSEFALPSGGGANIDGDDIWHAGNFDPDTKEDFLDNPANDGEILSSTAAGVRSWIPAPAGGSDPDWGDIGGTLANQTDLQAELDAKAATVHPHVMTDISDLVFPVTSVNGKTGALSLNSADVGALASNGKAVDSALFDGNAVSYFSLAGHDHTGVYLPLGGQAADSALLGGSAKSAFALSGHDHSGTYLPVAGKAADSSLLNAQPRTQFVSTADPDPAQGVDGDLWFKV